MYIPGAVAGRSRCFNNFVTMENTMCNLGCNRFRLSKIGSARNVQRKSNDIQASGMMFVTRPRTKNLFQNASVE